MSDSTEPLVANSSQTVGPFFHFGLVTDPRHGMMAGPETPGERIRLRICVIDGAGEPLPDALVELWQADASGTYSGIPDHPNPDPGQSFRGWGRLPTDASGVCEFDTIRPGATMADDGIRQAPHVNVCLFARGMLRHVFTRLYFAGDATLSDDPVLVLVPDGRRSTLIARQVEDTWVFVIRLQGDGETVFFDL